MSARGEMSERVTDDQMHGLDADEKSGMLFYLAGFLAKSEEFQDALRRAYNAQMRSRERLQRPQCERCEQGVAHTFHMAAELEGGKA